MKLLKEVLTLGLMGLLLLNMTPSILAQAKLEITGQVLDPNKASVAGAEVTLIDEAGKSFTAITDSQGRFRLTSLNLGTYQLTVSADGFSIYRDEKVKFDKPQHDPLAITLKVTNTNAEVMVKDDDTTQVSIDPAT